MFTPSRTTMLAAVLLSLSVWLAVVADGQVSEKPSTPPTGSPEGVEQGEVLIPGGEFLMGDPSEGDHNPPHKVRVESFYMDKFEVTNTQYLKYCQETDARLPEFWGIDQLRSGPKYPDHPVVGIGSTEAQAYAEWAGKRLPTEAEWEYAARGGLAGKKYPHGDELEPAVANYWVWEELQSSGKGLLPVGSYPPNGYGLHDMAGNVLEWVTDRYDAGYYKDSPLDNPQGPGEGRFRVIRGGGWHSGPSCIRVYYRNALPYNWRDFNVGFRCVRDVVAE